MEGNVMGGWQYYILKWRSRDSDQNIIVAKILKESVKEKLKERKKSELL
jgi:hypothetical protein